jgi:hypothetical protein
MGNRIDEQDVDGLMIRLDVRDQSGATISPKFVFFPS